MIWLDTTTFISPKALNESNIVSDLKQNYSVKRVWEFEYGNVNDYVCNINVTVLSMDRLTKRFDLIGGETCVNFFSLASLPMSMILFW